MTFHPIGPATSTSVNAVDWLNVKTGYGADNTGVADSTTAFTNALAAAPAGGVVYVPAGLYKISSQLVIPAGVGLIGEQAYRAVSASSQLNAFTMTTGSLIAFAAATPCGWVSGLHLNGSNLPAGTVDGIDCVGACKQGSIINVNINAFTNHGINIAASGGNPDGWYMHEISSHNNAGDGIHWDYSVDGQLDVFHLDNNTGSGLTIGTMNNCTISNGKCQQNANFGYALTGGFVRSNSTYSACFSENNQKDGWNFNTSGGGQGCIQLVGCSTRDDGTSGSSGSGFSGFVFQVARADILLVGCSNYVTASSAGPDNGLKLTSCTGNVNITGCSLIGGLAAYVNGGGNTLVRWSNNTVSTGQDDATRTIAQAPTNPAGFTPSDPGSTVSTTNVMMGIGSTCAYTPQGSGNLQIQVTGYLQIATAIQTCTIGARFGTSTAPVNGAADTGTRWGAAADPSLRPPAIGGPTALAFNGRITGLTPGTAYWFDLVLAVPGGAGADAASIKNISMTISEQP